MEKGINVLSLFDGISCGQVALERVGIKVDKYYASEIKKHAIKVTNENYPDTIQLGDVKNIKGSDLPKIDLLIGGSPCQNFSIANVSGRSGLNGSKSSLFYEYLRILEEVSPKYFILENVKMEDKYKKQIDDMVGVEGVLINSNLVSFQNRLRYYWFNVHDFKFPVDRNISFQDNKSTEGLGKYKVKRTPSREIMWEGKCPNVTYRDKINCLICKQDRWGNSGLVEYGDFCRYLTVEECEKAQTLPKGYTSCLSRNQSWDVLGDGWTVDVIAHILSFMDFS